MDAILKQRIIKEIRFLFLALLAYTAFYFLLAWVFELNMAADTYREAMVVMLLVIYLGRFVATVMKSIRMP